MEFTLFRWLNGFSVRKQIMEFGTATMFASMHPVDCCFLYLGLDL
jgi:hypothetical protein